LSEGGDQGLEEGVLSFGQFSLDFLKSGLNLGEGDTSLQVLDDLGSFIDGFDLLVVLGILVDPGFVLRSSQLLFGSEGVLVVLDVLGDDSNFLLGFSKGVGGVLSQLGQGDDLSLVVSNGLFEVIDEFLAGNLVVFIHRVRSLLVTLDLSGDVVHEQVNLVDGSTSGEVQLDDRQDRVTQGVLVNFSKHLFGVLKFVLLIGKGEGQGDCEY